ncbi:MAG: hypothetical protein QOI31_3076 [Solirubrobacterales bacterium]|jgi:hypothetical protein|nr:hypothetical protein [Solirubrobacterales bacterium]
MLSRVRDRLTYANVVATLALFCALGGGAYASHLAVRSSDIVDDQVKSADVRDDSKRGGGLTGDDINESTLGLVPEADLVDGRSASSFVANSTYRLGQGQERAGTELGDGSKVLSQSCLAGDRLLSGGPASVNTNSDVLDSFAQDTNTWQARINDSAVSGGDSFTVLVLCADQ